MRSEFRIALGMLGLVQASMRDIPIPPAERPASPVLCCEAPDADGLIRTDWTEGDKAGSLRDQEATLLRCRYHQLLPANAQR